MVLLKKQRATGHNGRETAEVGLIKRSDTGALIYLCLI